MAGAGVCVAEGKEEGKKKNPSCRALSLLFPTWCQGRDVCVAPRVPEPEPRGNVPAAPTGWAGQGRRRLWEPLAAAWFTSTEPDPLCRAMGLLEQMAGGAVRPARPSGCSCMQGTFCAHLLRCLKDEMAARWLMAPPLPILSCFLCSCFACCLMFHLLVVCALGCPEWCLDRRVEFCSNKTKQNMENMDNSSDGSWPT